MCSNRFARSPNVIEKNGEKWRHYEVETDDHDRMAEKDKTDEQKKGEEEKVRTEEGETRKTAVERRPEIETLAIKSISNAKLELQWHDWCRYTPISAFDVADNVYKCPIDRMTMAQTAVFANVLGMWKTAENGAVDIFMSGGPGADFTTFMVNEYEDTQIDKRGRCLEVRKIVKDFLMSILATPRSRKEKEITMKYVPVIIDYWSAAGEY